MDRTTQAILILGFSALVSAVLYSGNQVTQHLIQVSKQLDSQPYRIAEEVNLPPFKIPATRPALQDLPPEVVQRLLNKP